MRSLTRACSVVLSVVAISCGGHADPQVPQLTSPLRVEETDRAWAEMNRVLQGSWIAVTTDKRTIRTSYRTVSKGSALVETFTTASGSETITVFHRDGDQMMLTHYCAQGNQARLKATLATQEKIVFEFVDATNVKSDQGVMQKLVMTFRSDGFDQEGVYLADGKLDSTLLHFSRAVPGKGE